MKTKDIIIFGVCILIAALVLGIFFYKARFPQNTIRVTGYATKGFESDMVKWSFAVSRSAGLKDIKNGYQLLTQDMDLLITELEMNGIDTGEISIQPPSAQPQYNRDGQISGYSIRQNIFVISHNLKTVEKLALKPDFIYEKGIILEYSNLEYNYSKIADLKKELLADATKDAMNRALEISKSSGAKLGKMVSARQGVFQITEPYSTEVSDYGVYSTATKKKNITVTVTASFIIK
jgi:hypothetical protein